MEQLTTIGLKLISTYIDKNNPKFELNGAYLDKEANRIISTNTRALLSFKHELDFEGIVHKDLFTTAIATATAYFPKNVFFYERDGEAYHFGSSRVMEIQTLISDERDKKNGLLLGLPEINGKFPDWKRLLLNEDSYDIIQDDEVRYFDEDKKENPIPKMKIIECKQVVLKMEINKLGVMVDEAYINPLIEYADKTSEGNFTIRFTSTHLPIQISHRDFDIIVMPIVY